MLSQINKHRIILASRSPRRQYLLKEMGINFEVMVRETEESYPESLREAEIPIYLSRKKALAFEELVSKDENTVIIAADTIVWFEGKEIGKPADRENAIQTLKLLSGKMHQVFTGVTLLKKYASHSFSAESKVYFKPFSQSEIEFYLDTYKPYDKAGAYGAQEWLGYIGIERIEGSYFNVMGLPTKKLWEELIKFIS